MATVATVARVAADGADEAVVGESTVAASTAAVAGAAVRPSRPTSPTKPHSPAWAHRVCSRQPTPLAIRRESSTHPSVQLKTQMVEKAANPVKSLVEILLLFPLLFPIFESFFLGSRAKQIRKKASYVEGGRINICLASFFDHQPALPKPPVSLCLLFGTYFLFLFLSRTFL